MCNQEKNAKVISFINMKGGVGKTTLTINIAHTLVEHFNKTVLLIDMDPQFNATQALMTKFKSINEYHELRKEKRTIAHLLLNYNSMVGNEKISIGDNIIVRLNEKSNEAYLDFIAGDLNLTNLEASSRGTEKLLATTIENLGLLKKYDYILIDTPATYSVYSQTSLLASEYYLVPISPDVFASLGYELLENKLQEDLALKDHPLKKLGIIFTLTSKNKAKRNNIQESFSDKDTFLSSLKEYENIRAGNINNFIYDMTSSKQNMIELTQEFIDKLEGENND